MLLFAIKCRVAVVCVVVIITPVYSAGGLTTTVQCGNKRCRLDEYCSQHTYDCTPCSRICDKNSNNYDPHTCEQQCQNYLHVIRFVERGSSGVTAQPVVTTTSSSTEKNAYMLALVALIVAFIALVLVIIILVFGLIYLKRKNLIFSKSKKKLANSKVNNNDAAKNDNQKISYKVDNLKLEMPPTANPVPAAPSSVTGTHDPLTPATTSTPLSRPRHPVEDRTLEYAYDNPALTPSPVLEKDDQQQTLPSRMESSF